MPPPKTLPLFLFRLSLPRPCQERFYNSTVSLSVSSHPALSPSSNITLFSPFFPFSHSRPFSSRSLPSLSVAPLLASSSSFFVHFLFTYSIRVISPARLSFVLIPSRPARQCAPDRICFICFSCADPLNRDFLAHSCVPSLRYLAPRTATEMGSARF